MYECRKCKTELTNDNWSNSNRERKDYRCKECVLNYQKEYRKNNKEKVREARVKYMHESGRQKPMSENKDCASFLGVHVAERVLSRVFKNVERMVYGHKGYDFICNKGYKIDVKSSCRHNNRKNNKNVSDYWQFVINKNKIPDYFLCLAFDNRDNLKPLHIWLIPCNNLNDKKNIAISESKLDKWNHYRIDKMEEITGCCDLMKNP